MRQIIGFFPFLPGWLRPPPSNCLTTENPSPHPVPTHSTPSGPPLNYLLNICHCPASPLFTFPTVCLLVLEYKVQDSKDLTVSLTDRESPRA